MMGNGGRLKVIGIGLIGLGALIAAFAGPVEETGPIALLGPIVMIVGGLVHFRGRRHVARAAAGSILGDAKADVLYLRTFRGDTSTIGKVAMSGLATDEEELADAVRPFGHLVAIGRPGESLPLPGAARVYVSDPKWAARLNARKACGTEAAPTQGLPAVP